MNSVFLHRFCPVERWPLTFLITDDTKHYWREYHNTTDQPTDIEMSRFLAYDMALIDTPQRFSVDCPFPIFNFSDRKVMNREMLERLPAPTKSCLMSYYRRSTMDNFMGHILATRSNHRMVNMMWYLTAGAPSNASEILLGNMFSKCCVILDMLER